MRHHQRPRPAVEPRRTAEEYIDDLRIKKSAANAQPVTPGTNRTPGPIQRPSSVARGMVVLGIVAVVFGCGWATAAMQYVSRDVGDPAPGKPSPVVTVTVTKTVRDLPKACQQALIDFDKYLDGAAAISAANTQQLDLMAEANQAIMLKDWKALGLLTDRQRNLERELGPAASKVLPPLIEVKKGMEKCRSQLN